MAPFVLIGILILLLIAGEAYHLGRKSLPSLLISPTPQATTMPVLTPSTSPSLILKNTSLDILTPPEIHPEIKWIAVSPITLATVAFSEVGWIYKSGSPDEKSGGMRLKGKAWTFTKIIEKQPDNLYETNENWVDESWGRDSVHVGDFELLPLDMRSASEVVSGIKSETGFFFRININEEKVRIVTTSFDVPDQYIKDKGSPITPPEYYYPHPKTYTVFISDPTSIKDILPPNLK